MLSLRADRHSLAVLPLTNVSPRAVGVGVSKLMRGNLLTTENGLCDEGQ
ncbi:MAG: hypothetical protein J6V99_02265 [Neisseriaceae bacterium]|nr:hypothetical protein [Neisseriaceae bacterium]